MEGMKRGDGDGGIGREWREGMEEKGLEEEEGGRGTGREREEEEGGKRIRRKWKEEMEEEGLEGNQIWRKEEEGLEGNEKRWRKRD